MMPIHSSQKQRYVHQSRPSNASGAGPPSCILADVPPVEFGTAKVAVVVPDEDEDAVEGGSTSDVALSK